MSERAAWSRAAAESALTALEATLENCLLSDRRRLAKAVARLRQALRRAAPGGRAPAAWSERLVSLERAFERSCAAVAERATQEPSLVWPDFLPISACRDNLRRLLETHQVIVVSGATGSGKSTQLPKLCLDAARGTVGRIGHTQPRRIAARAIAARLAAETATLPGRLVGHSVRFDENLAPAARIKVMTDGILLNEIHADPLLLQYDTLIIDEVHERTLNIDILLGYLRRILPRRGDLKLLVTSATFDTAAIADCFPGAALYNVPGRTFPIETRYRPFDDEEVADLNDAIVAAIAELDDAGREDVLVFLPGEREIREAAVRLARSGLADTEVLQLFARMSAARQARIFAPGQRRRVVLATNVAETSLTVPGVRHVIDSGLARVSRYSPRRKLQQLPIEKIARANADQRRGRCGREAPGVCIRLYSEADYAARRASIEPEIQRTSLAGVILRLKALGVDDIGHFPFVDRPAERLVKDAYAELQEIGALDGARAITAMGRALNAYPVDPRLARVLVAGSALGCLREALVIVAALSVVDPRERPHALRDAADRAHAQFADKRSDFLWFVKAWPFAQDMLSLTADKRQRRCRRAMLSPLRLKEWTDLHVYLSRLTAQAGLRDNPEPASYKSVHLALLTGFPTLVAEWQGDQYRGCRDATFALHPASTLARRGVPWVLAGDIVETARPYARLAARIDAAWIEQAAGHLLKRHYDAPHWDAQRGSARVTEIQRLFGLVVRADRVIDLVRVDREQARTLFIEHGLIDGELGENPAFLVHNQSLISRVQALEARARRRDLLAPRARLFAFYATRLPPDICTRRDLRRWLRGNPERDDGLMMEEADATNGNLQDVPAYLFPEWLDIAGTRCALEYRFEPGQPRDGVTVAVPLVLLPRLDHAAFDRLVPGLTGAKIERLLRNLPKPERRRFSPLREFAMAATEAVAGNAAPLPAALAEALANMTGQAVDASWFDEKRLPDHLRCNIDLIDADGAVVASGRDLDSLRDGRSDAAQAACAAIDWGLGGRSRSDWTFGDLPATVDAYVAANRIRGFPALTDCGEVVELCVYDSPEQAAAVHRDGVARLLLLGVARDLRHLERDLVEAGELALLGASFGFRAGPVRYLARACAQRWAGAAGAVRNAAAYAALTARFSAAFATETATAARRLHGLLRRGAVIRQRLDDTALGLPRATRDDLGEQLAELLGPDLAAAVDRDGAARHDRYLDAVERRLERVSANPGKDLQKLDRITPLWQRFLASAARRAQHDAAALEELRSLIEEYRISLFAPEIGTARSVSAARLNAALDALEGSAIRQDCV